MRSNRFTGITDVKVTTLNGTVLDTESTYITMPTYLTPQSLFIPDISYEGEHNSLFSAKGVDWALALSEDTPRNERKPRLPLYDVNDREVGVIEVNKSGMVYVTPLEQETAIEQPRNVYVFATLVSNPEIETVYLITFSRYGEGYVLNGSEVEFTATAPNPIPYLSVDIQGSQDLNGYDRAWLGGTRKNISPPISEWSNGFWTSQGALSPQLSSSLEKAYEGYISVLPETTYTLSINVDGELPSEGYLWQGFCTYNASKEFIQRNTSQSRVGNTSLVYTFTTDASTYFIRPSCRTYGLPITIQIEKGSTATAYLPYANICPITSYDSVTITQNSKNLLNTLQLYDGGSYNSAIGTVWTLTPSTKTLTDNGDGTFTLDLTLDHQESGWKYVTMLAEVSANTDYWVHFQRQAPHIRHTIGFLSSTYEVLSAINNSATDYTIDGKYTSPSNRAYFYIVITNAGYTDTLVTITKPMVEEGSTATSYEPYAKVYTVELTDAGNVYKGTLDVTNGKLVIEQRMMEFDGSNDEVWALVATGLRYAFRVTLPRTSKATQTAISERLTNGIKLSTSSEGSEVEKDILTMRGTAYAGLVAYIFSPTLTTVEELRAWLANNIVQYVYPVEQTITLTPVQISNLIGYNKITANSGDVTAIVMPDSL